MRIGNQIVNGAGEVVGFICSECDQIRVSMWGDLCNSCRAIERRHKETLKRQSITDAIQLLEAQGYKVTK
jgi:hypothetical protein